MAGKYKLDWTDLAFEALEDIYDFITKQAQSEAPAKKVVKKIFKSAEILLLRFFRRPVKLLRILSWTISLSLPIPFRE
ncbi:MAG: hypothetical protein NT150_02405 [Bacteroidetes bacterium]|nr:hypothetical protein [Bacteroidota bacterium]